VPTDFRSHLQAAIGDAYVLEREVGRGGAAAVFLARDKKHDRPVAFKVLLREVASSLTVERFLREIRLAARLAHPNILPVLDSGSAGELPYYVTPYVEGEALRVLMERAGQLDVEVALSLAHEVADALEYAHAAGIVHRDVKPDNILLLSGHAVLADFGIARAMFVAQADRPLTSLGLAVGTPAYMSPEQASGEDNVDGRSDQYALGAMLFEMLTGQPPFKASSPVAVIAKQFSGPAPRVQSLRPDLPPAIDAAISRALATNPEHRFASIIAFVQAAAGADPTAAVTRASQTLASRHSAVRAVLAATPQTPSVAVLPFHNGSGDPNMEFFSDGITDEIISALSRVRNLQVAARSSCYALKGQALDARTVGDRLRVGAILEGSVRRSGDRVRISAHLVDARTGFQLWSDHFDGDVRDVFAIEDEIGRRIVERLEVKLLGDAARPMTEARPTTVAAHDAYLRGRHAAGARTEAGLLRSLELFDDALREDPQYVPALASRGESLALLAIYGVRPPSTVMPFAREAAEAALDRDPAHADAYITVGTVRALYEWDWIAADASFRRAVTIDLRSAPAHQRWALDSLVPRGRFAEAITHIDRACTLDTLSPVMRASAGVVRYFAGDVTGALQCQRDALALDPSFAMANFFLGGTLRDSGAAADAVTAFEHAIAAAGRTPEMLAGLAQALAPLGRASDADSLRDELERLSAERYVSPALFAQVELALGHPDRALDWLSRAEQARDPELAYVAVRPVYRALHGDARFEQLLGRLGLTRREER
jgi:serine/threonine protein kinase/tetratricopeptide (TPR) repeat protein